MGDPADQVSTHNPGAAEVDTPPAHDAGSTEIERNDNPEVSQQDEGPAATSTDNGERTGNGAPASDEARTDNDTVTPAPSTTSTTSASPGAPVTPPASGRPDRDDDKAGEPETTPPSPQPSPDGKAGDTPRENGATDADLTAPLAPPTSLHGPAKPETSSPVYDVRRTVIPAPIADPTEVAPRPGAYGDGRRPGVATPPTIGDDTPTVRPARHLRRSDDGLPKPPTVDKDERRRRRNLLLAVSPVFIVLLIVVAWAVDTVTLSGQVLRNVTLAGNEVGGEGEDSLSERVADMAAEVAARPVVIDVQPATSGFAAGGQQTPAEPRTYETTAGELGLALDEEATVEATLDEGRGGTLFLRPFKWLGSFLSSRDAPLEFRMSEAQTVTTLQALQGTDMTAPVEPNIQLVDGQFVPVAGHPGTGLDAIEVADALLAAVEESDSVDGAIEISATQTEVAPRLSQQDAEQLATRANDMTADGLTLQAAEVTATVPVEQLRSWITPVVVEEGSDFRFDLNFNAEAATQAAPQVLSELTAEPQNATVALEGGQPVVRPGRAGAACCGDDAGARMWEALQAGEPELAFEVEAQEPEHTTEEVEGWGITQPIGGARAHQNGADIGGPAPGFTTYHDCCAARVTNIHRIAQEANGAVIPPGGSFSLNDHVGERTAADGYVAAGAIRDGQHVDEIGGGVSQFFTTLFNAAYFAGLDITEYQAHTENFTRYPDGREATGGFPNPDLVIENNTPYGVLIQTSYTDTSITVTLWSTQHATAEQTNVSSSPAGAVCTNVTSTRTRTFPDGSTEQDSFEATYRPTGRFCDGTPTATTPPAG